MKIGIVSDTHGMSNRLVDAVKQLVAAGAQALVHCGDIESLADARFLASHNIPAYLAAGNCDRRDISALQKVADQAGLAFASDFVAVPIGDGQHLAATHGHLQHLLDELIIGGQFSYVCHGHTHRRRDDRIGTTRVLNPGSLYNPRSGSPTVILLDTTADKIKPFDVK